MLLLILFLAVMGICRFVIGDYRNTGYTDNTYSTTNHGDTVKTVRTK